MTQQELKERLHNEKAEYKRVHDETQLLLANFKLKHKNRLKEIVNEYERTKEPKKRKTRQDVCSLYRHLLHETNSFLENHPDNLGAPQVQYEESDLLVCYTVKLIKRNPNK